MVEETHHGIIGRKIPASTFEELIDSMKSLGNSVSMGCNLITEEMICLGMLVKYGMLYLTFERTDQEGFIRIYALTETSGRNYFRKADPNIKFETYYKKYTQNPELLFPLGFEIKDCCKTDNEYIWQDKYFYV